MTSTERQDTIPAASTEAPAPRTLEELAVARAQPVTAKFNEVRRVLAEEANIVRLTRAQVRGVVDGLQNCWTPAAIADAIGLEAKDVLDIVADLGTWLSHSRRKPAGAPDIQFISHDSTGELFPLNETEGEVIIPRGFNPSGDGHKRDVRKSLAAVVMYAPDDEEIGRHLDRKYPSSVSQLEYTNVSSVWFFAKVSMGMLARMDEVSPHGVFHRPTLEAVDLLTVAIGDAITGVSLFAELSGVELAITKDGTVAPVIVRSPAALDTLAAKLPALRDAAVAIGWLQSGEMQRLVDLIDIVEQSPSALRSVQARLGTIARAICDVPKEWVITAICDLTQGQVEQIARRAGLSIDGVSRAEEAQIRAQLTVLGLRKDIDMRLPEAKRALQAGVLDRFYAAVEAHQSDGSRPWADVLQDLYSE